MLASLTFLADLDLYRGEKPYVVTGLSSEFPQEKLSNMIFETHQAVPVQDSRVAQEDFSLDKHGFIWIKSASEYAHKTHAFEDPMAGQDVVLTYLEETIAIVQKVTKAERVLAFDWRFRRNGGRTKQPDVTEGLTTARYRADAPVHKVHCDYSCAGGHSRVRMHLTDTELEEAEASGCKLQILNSWRPCRTVENSPLAFCDRRTILASDVVVIDKVLPNVVEEETRLLHRDHHDWYWRSQQQPDEMALFVEWDSDAEADQTVGVFHSACDGPESQTGSVPRESIEIRLIVITK